MNNVIKIMMILCMACVSLSVLLFEFEVFPFTELDNNLDM